MAGPVKFSQEMMDQATAALRAQIGDFGFVLCLIEGPEDKTRIMMATNMGLPHVRRALTSASQSVMGLEKDPRLPLDEEAAG